MFPVMLPSFDAEKIRDKFANWFILYITSKGYHYLFFGSLVYVIFPDPRLGYAIMATFFLFFSVPMVALTVFVLSCEKPEDTGNHIQKLSPKQHCIEMLKGIAFLSCHMFLAIIIGALLIVYCGMYFGPDRILALYVAVIFFIPSMKLLGESVGFKFSKSKPAQ